MLSDDFNATALGSHHGLPVAERLDRAAALRNVRQGSPISPLPAHIFP
jgi:hypothetical protein